MFTQTDSSQQQAASPSPATPSKRWQQCVGLLALVLVAAVVSACGGVQSIPDSHNPVVYGLSMLSSTDGWAVGAEDNYRAQGMIAHYQDGSWKPVSLPASIPALRSIFMLSASDGWAVGRDGAILQYQHGSWSSSANSPTSSTLNSVFMLSPDEGWRWAAIFCIISRGSGCM